ncbi:MotA/TolQ/ExbB proton channel family protein [Sphingomonas sp. 22176]|uniref:MotA/TolQ/ExbB proton channel family protein n=1 Tax=Sphingomonas sp. 22176 TaxID=3453884 RepID=UPI003F844B03
MALCLLPMTAWCRPLAAKVNFDAFAMFLNAEPVVKLVMIVLVGTSFVSWALCVVKAREISAGVRAVRESTARLKAARRLGELDALDAATTAMLDAARGEIAQSGDLIRQNRVDGASQRVEDKVARIEAHSVLAMRRGLPVFASISSVGPFVGLFGTVWGIMHSFIGISAAKSTSLAVVAPGISEALLATALGLVAAIPATIMYNYLLQRLAAYRETLEMSATMIAGLASREMEFIAMTGEAAVAASARASARSV